MVANNSTSIHAIALAVPAMTFSTERINISVVVDDDVVEMKHQGRG